MGSLHILMLPPTVQRYGRSGIKLIGDSKLLMAVCLYVLALQQAGDPCNPELEKQKRINGRKDKDLNCLN